MAKKKKRILPEWVDTTDRQFKARKRKEFNEALRAMEKLAYGCAYMPRSDDIGFNVSLTRTQMKEAKKKLQQWWGKA